MKKAVIAIFTLISFLYAGNRLDTDRDLNPFPFWKPFAQGPDIAYALMIKGEIVNCFMNYGQITDGYFQSEFYNLSWPKSKGAITVGDAAVDDFSFMFARKGNVIDGFSSYRQEDWSPVEGSWGRYHAKDQSDDLKHQGYPHLAVSDLEVTWPEGYDDSTGNFVATPGEHHWPGHFRIDINPDSPTYGQEVPGEFPADRVVYCAMDDHTNAQNPPLGIRLDVEALEYGRPYAADFQFFDVTITNTSDSTLDSCYWGYYYDIDFGEYEDEAYYVYNSGLNPGEWDVMYEMDPEITDPTEFEHGAFGVAFLKTPKDMGITDAHYYLDTGPTTDEELYPLMISDPNDPAISLRKAEFFHGSNVHLDDFSGTQSTFGFDWVCLVSTGPFDLAPGESVKSVVLVCAGSDPDDFKANVNMAISMMQKGYQGPSGPKPPKLYAVPGDQQVTLYWSNEPELTPDPFSGEYDFEGYKIYRSMDGGQTWGKEILDGSGSLVGYLPVKSFDLNNTVSGLDPLNANFNLGSNTGIVHSWVDTDVKNGFEYSYTITAYDRGDPANNIQSFESSKGSGVNEDNFVVVTPNPPALGFVDPAASYEHSSGYGKGYLDISILDYSRITDHTYQITFSDSPAVSFNVKDATSGETKLSGYPINTDEMPAVDGFSVRVNGDEEFGGVSALLDEYGRDVSSSDKTDTTGSWYVTYYQSWSRGDFDSRTSDYEIRFTSQGSNIASRIGATATIAEHVPFEVWNTTFNKQVTAIVTDDGDSTFDEGEIIYIVNLPYQELNIGDTYSLSLVDDVPYKISIDNAESDTLNQIPMEGQVVRIVTKRAFTPSDRFTIQFTGHSYEVVSKEELKKIRVVPNPYVVNAAWEQAQNVRMLEFQYLPPVCTIQIYTTRGEKVTTLVHDDGTGSQSWNITSDSNQDLAYGTYIYIVKTPEGNQYMGKFALIK